MFVITAPSLYHCNVALGVEPTKEDKVTGVVPQMIVLLPLAAMVVVLGIDPTVIVKALLDALGQPVDLTRIKL